MRTIGVITVGRSDYGIYLPILRRLRQRSDVCLKLLISGSHLSREFGHTVDQIARDGLDTSERLEGLLLGDSPEAVAKSMGLTTISFAQRYARGDLDLLLALGDRFEMMAAALAAVPFNLPLAHVHGGELTEGAMDDRFRHCLTKLSHLHFVSTQAYRHRVIQLGEEPWRVEVSGAPGLDNLSAFSSLSSEELGAELGLSFRERPLLVTFHPSTLEFELVQAQTTELLKALAEQPLPIVFTLQNPDTGGRVIGRLIESFCAENPGRVLIKSCGTRIYFSLMHWARAMVGNSSSGIIEAPSVGLPVVNIGERQAGRVRGANVIDCGPDAAAIAAALQVALSPEFVQRAASSPNPYFQEGGLDRMVERLATCSLDLSLLRKRFFDISSAGVGAIGRETRQKASSA
ncbi:UDP-N-acetylglucosamine 2-epimerase (hydrolyzing) [bacterium CPR1]|nr:UDP-N-acetylglucosamine 2-epimerase (hydrolyzing) [bacterium CPR1]